MLQLSEISTSAPGCRITHAPQSGLARRALLEIHGLPIPKFNFY